MFNYTIETANDWKNALSFASKDSEYLHQRVLISLSPSQLESKSWMVNTMREVDLNCKVIAILGGWFAQYTVPLLMETFNPKLINNFEIDPDVKKVTYKFNKRYNKVDQYYCYIRNVMFEHVESNTSFNRGGYDTIINTSCEHMFPMSKFKELNFNRGNPIYVLQSSDDDKYDDHINCVQSADELADQAKLVEVMYSGEKKLINGMTRFMVIGR